MIEKLKNLGLTDGEAKVYNAMLKKGSSTVGPLVKESGVAYSNIYEILERLINKGLVSHIIKEKTKHFQITNPENLNIYLEKKQEELDHQKKLLNNLMPEITTASKQNRQEAEIFTGYKGVRTAYEIMLEDAKEKDDFLFFFPYHAEESKEMDEFYLRIINIFKKKKVNLKGISPEGYRTSPALKVTPYGNMKHVNFPVPTTIDICKDKLLFISWKHKPTGFLIQSQELADQFKKYFYSVWKKAKP